MRFSNAFVTVDALIFKPINNNNYLLLIQRKNESFKNSWVKTAQWFSVNELREMAFVHLEIIKLALTKI